jgi:asparagine synthase (glutamine-hydrolysing)
MGAIAGWASGAARDEAALAPMLESLAHRKGDPLSGFIDRRRNCQVVFGASFYDAHSRIAVVLDGAIANREELRPWLAKRGFQVNSDAELLLRAYQYWDKDAVKHLRGGFAFAIWDGRKERLFLARDRFGEKPLYLREVDGSLRFASEAKALALPGDEVDLEAVWEHLAYHYVPGPRTLVKGIRKLPPATYALWQFRKLRETRYWIPPDQKPSIEEASTIDPVEGFIQRLDDAVKLSLPGGVFLSGGIDSAMIVALAAQQGV